MTWRGCNTGCKKRLALRDSLGKREKRKLVVAFGAAQSSGYSVMDGFRRESCSAQRQYGRQAPAADFPAQLNAAMGILQDFPAPLTAWNTYFTLVQQLRARLGREDVARSSFGHRLFARKLVTNVCAEYFWARRLFKRSLPGWSEAASRALLAVSNPTPSGRQSQPYQPDILRIKGERFLPHLQDIFSRPVRFHNAFPGMATGPL